MPRGRGRDDEGGAVVAQVAGRPYQHLVLWLIAGHELGPPTRASGPSVTLLSADQGDLSRSGATDAPTSAAR